MNGLPKKTESTNFNAETETTWKLPHSYSQLLQLLYYSTYLIDTLLKYCTCHAKRKNDLPARKLEVAKKHFARNFLQFWQFQAENGRFPAFYTGFCEAFPTFHKMLPLPRLLTLCRAGGRKNANATSTHVTKRNQKHAICEEIDVQHIRRITCLSQFASAAQRWGLATSLRVTLPGCGCSSNPGRTWLQPPDIPRLCPKQLPGCLGRITAGCLVLYSEVGVWNRTCGKWKSTYWLLFWDPYHGLS